MYDIVIVINPKMSWLQLAEKYLYYCLLKKRIWRNWYF